MASYARRRKWGGPVKARITISTAQDGELQIWLNEAGRDQLIEALRGLNDTSNDHLHLWTWDEGDLPLSDRAYRPEDTIVDTVEVLFRPDAWDREYFPHVFDGV